MPKERLPENKQLPSRWTFRRNAYYYQVPPGYEQFWEGKKMFRLGGTLAEAYRSFNERALILPTDHGKRPNHKRKYLPLHLLEEVDRAAAGPEDFPLIAGVYFLWRDGAICYIGQSQNIHARIPQHAFEYTGVSTIQCDDKDTRLLLEATCIRRFQPPENTVLKGTQTNNLLGVVRERLQAIEPEG